MLRKCKLLAGLGQFVGPFALYPILYLLKNADVPLDFWTSSRTKKNDNQENVIFLTIHRVIKKYRHFSLEVGICMDHCYFYAMWLPCFIRILNLLAFIFSKKYVAFKFKRHRTGLPAPYGVGREGRHHVKFGQVGGSWARPAVRGTAPRDYLRVTRPCRRGPQNLGKKWGRDHANSLKCMLWLHISLQLCPLSRAMVLFLFGSCFSDSDL